MASFSSASRWLKLVFFQNTLGFALLVFSMFFGGRNSPGDISTNVLTFVFYLVALCLTFSWTFVEEARNNKGVHVSTIVFDICAGVVAIAMLALAGTSRHLFHANGLLLTTAALFALLAGIFAIVEISGEVNFKVKMPSPRKAKKEKDVEAAGEEKEEAVELEETKEDAKPTEGAAAAATDDANGHVVKEEKKEEEKKEEDAEQKEEQKEEAKEETKEETPKEEAAKE